jgi:hypothetical protein
MLFPEAEMMGSPDAPAQNIEVVESVEVRVYRTTYRLPLDKAEALQQFVAQHFLSQVETRVDGDRLVVMTHSPEDEETMRRFIYLMVGVPAPSAAGGGSLPILPLSAGAGDPFAPTGN